MDKFKEVATRNSIGRAALSFFTAFVLQARAISQVRQRITSCGLRVEIAQSEEGFTIVQVLVRDNNVDQALRALKKKMQREGVFREMKLRRNYEKPSEKRARERAEAVRRSRKLLRKRLEREGY